MFFSRVVMLRLSFGWASCQPFKRFTCSFENRSITLICRPVQTPFLVCVANFYGRQQFYDQLHLLQINFPCSDQLLLEKTAAPKYLINQIESGPNTNKICMGRYYLYMLADDFYRTQVTLGSGLLVPVSVTPVDIQELLLRLC